MAWRRIERMIARNYNDPNERRAYRLGYKDGHAGLQKDQRSVAFRYPNAYNAGYWDGKADAAEPSA